MLETPRKYTLVAAAAEGPTRLNAFDNALLGAGIGNLNLLRVSSILPPGAQQVDEIQLPEGSLVPTAFGTIDSESPGELISAGIAVGIDDGGRCGVIMEFSGRCSQRVAEEEVRGMVVNAFRQRGRTLKEIQLKTVEHRVERIGCVFAAIALWS